MRRIIIRGGLVFMKILITGANGFIGKNLIAELKNRGFDDLLYFTRENNIEELFLFLDKADLIFHLAGINRPKSEEEFTIGNIELTKQITEYLISKNKNTPIIYTSSIQAELDNSYGISKKAAERLLEKYAEKIQAQISIYRLTNVFGKWSKPNYNTVIATFCHNLTRGIEIQIDNPNHILNLVYIDDVVYELISCIEAKKTTYEVQPVYQVKLSRIAELLYSFVETRKTLNLPNLSDSFEKKLYSTYLSYLPEDEFSYELKMNVDHRGSFTEFIRTADRGQVSINISKPGITKGNHWHHTKNEKFLVVSGEGIIRFRKIGEDKVIEYRVSGEKLTVVDIPVGYTHSIVNVGDTDLVTVMWVNELFDPKSPDTNFLEV